MRLLLATLLLLGLALPASAKRVALVIGNDAYVSVPRLAKARGDATAVSAELNADGFQVLTAYDATRREMSRRVADFIGALDPGDTALIYYSGHGVEIDGQNYLLPTDIAAPEAGGSDFIKLESFSLGELLDSVHATGARTTLVFLDACRNNPFADKTGRSIGQAAGLGRVAAPEGTFVVFSAGAGQTALDSLGETDRNPNSVFTRNLLPLLRKPDLELRTLVSELRVAVRDLAKTRNHDQFPAYYDELLGDFYFAKATTAPAPAPVDDTQTIRDDFRLANEIGTPEALKGFLARHGDSKDFSVDLARRALAAMEAGAQAGGRSAAPDPATEAVPASAAPPPADPRQIARLTQVELNRLGCSAGRPDGILGTRSRAAFGRYLDTSGTLLIPAALGSAKALNELKATRGTPCARAVAAATPPAEARAAPVPGPAGVDITGTWQIHANCPLWLTVTGTATYHRTGPNSFRYTAANSLGWTGTGQVTFDGNRMKGAETWSSGVRARYSGQISADGRSMTGSTTTGCGFQTTR